MRAPRLLVFLFLAPLVPAGCVAVLGDFDVGGAPAAVVEAGDAPTETTTDDAETGTGIDGGDGEAGPSPLPLLACDTWTLRNGHQLVASRRTDVGTRTFDKHLEMRRSSNRYLRLVAYRDMTGNALYTINVDQTSPSTVAADLDPASQFGFGPLRDMRKTLSDMHLVFPNFRGGIAAVVIADGDPGNGPWLPVTVAPDGTFGDAGGGGNADIRGAGVLLQGQGDYFWVAQYQNQASANFPMLAGRSSGTQQLIDRPTMSSDFAGLVQYQGTAYLFTMGTLGHLYEIPVAAPFGGGSVVPHTFGSPGDPLLIGAGASSTLGSFNLAFGELPVSGTPFARLHVGGVDAAHVESVSPQALPVAATIATADDAPFGDGNGGWIGDDFALIGSGGGTAPGVNFVWVDAAGNLRSQQTGTNRLLTDRGRIYGVTLVRAESISPSLVSWDVVWIERKNDGSDYDEIYYDSLRCAVK